MNIGFDGKRAVQNLTGLGNYSRLILESVAGEYPQDHLTIFAPRRRDNPRLRQLLMMPNVSFRYPRSGEAPLGRAWWRTRGITRLLPAEKIDLFHGLSNELPLNIGRAQIPSVLTMHDVIYRTMPECYSSIDRVLYNIKYGASCRIATRIIAISECTKRDILRYYDVEEGKIDVIYQGCDEIFKQPVRGDALAGARTKYRLPERFILQVGSIERRKNALLTVRSLAALPEEVELVLVGRETPYLKEVLAEARKLRLSPRIKILSNVPFPDLPLLYHLASAAVYPSRYEGFGLPVIEALTCATPCVAATGSCLEEAGGDAALYVSPDDSRALGEALRSILDSPDLQKEMTARGLTHASRFSNADVASATHAVYEHALRDFREAHK